MTREELKRHCEKQIEECERWAKHKGEEPHGKIYEEHKLILELLQQQPKTGHWIYDGDQIICNRCFKAFGFISLKLTTDYCPNCGTKMADEVIVE
jgi:hypothetical protein